MSAMSFAQLMRTERALIMGVVNTTPDSFSDGGKFLEPKAAIEHALTLAEEGADILDIGGESTRPGAAPVSVQEELDRVVPVIEALRKKTDVLISVDTSKAEVMRAATIAGAGLINDVRALTGAGALAVAVQSDAAVCLMHMQGTPQDMQDAPVYASVTEEVTEFLRARVDACRNAGIPSDRLLVDPGIGFGKELAHNLRLLKDVSLLRDRLGCPVLIGVSRKSMIDRLLGREVDGRLYASVGLAVQAALNGAKILRVHDVRATFDALRSVEAVMRA